ncbi:MAG: phosphoesterase [Candidatus Heimdallarchaeota archaeon]|nr:phosphoesterase [Candidatus Heimdallarchaeota archaeon]
MKTKCPTCKGTGRIVKDKMTCSACLGIGKTSFSLGSERKEGDICETCKGKGKVVTHEKCPTCEGNKVVHYCSQCKKLMKTSKPSGLCQKCSSLTKPLVYALKPPIDIQLVRKGMLLLSRVDSVKRVGVFVKITKGINVLIRPQDQTRDYAWDIGEEVIVEIQSISEKGKFYGIPKALKDYAIESLRSKVRDLQILDITPEKEGSFISFKAKIVSVLQTSGPTRFTFVDTSGSINGAAFTKAGERAFPDIEEDMIVQVFGEISKFKDSMQIEIKDLEELNIKEAQEFLKAIEKAIDEKSQPALIDFLVKSPLLAKLKPGLEKAAKRIRKAIFTGQRIYIRHHADADGVVSGFSIQYAIVKLMESEGYDADTIRIRVKRSPNKPPFYDTIDVTRDLDFALGDQKRFGDKLPLFVCLDFGSSTESLFAYLQIKSLDQEIIVIDHHFPDEKIKEIVDIHVNPYFVGGGYELSAGMLAYELARLINPTITDTLKHLPAIAGLMDRVEGEEIEEYIEIAKVEGYDLDQLKKIGLAVDFELYQLRFSEGNQLIHILLDVDVDQNWHKKMSDLLSEEATKLMKTSVDNILLHSRSKELENGLILVSVDVELYTHRFTFPNPGKITGQVFDHFCNKNEGKAIITFGEGPDFLILRSKGVKINIPEAIQYLQKKIPEAGIQGGGHEVVGSFKFYEGKRKNVKKEFIAYLSKLTLIEETS